jgi:hypothetical protein
LTAAATLCVLALHSRMTLAEWSRNWIRYCTLQRSAAHRHSCAIRAAVSTPTCPLCARRNEHDASPVAGARRRAHGIIPEAHPTAHLLRFKASNINGHMSADRLRLGVLSPACPLSTPANVEGEGGAPAHWRLKRSAFRSGHRRHRERSEAIQKIGAGGRLWIATALRASR